MIRKEIMSAKLISLRIICVNNIAKFSPYLIGIDVQLDIQP